MTDPRFPQIVLLHDRGDLPNGAVERLEAVLRAEYPMLDYARPFIPDVPSGQAFEGMKEYYVKRLQPNALLVGFGRGGLLACALQSEFPALHLSVFAINAPTFDISLRVQPCQNPYSRVSIYSSSYVPIVGRSDWTPITPLAFNVIWLSKGHTVFYPLAYLISSFAKNRDMAKEVSMMFPAV